MIQAASDFIYRVATKADWAAAQHEGVYAGAVDDARDGFLHFSTGPQLAETLRRHYAGAGDLVLLTIRAADLDLVWEPSRGGTLFPHLYALLPVAKVARIDPLPLGPNGARVLPAGLT